jgi:hypothetical protein
MDRIKIILAAVILAVTILSCKSKEAVTKETTVTNTEQQLSTKDSTTHSSIIVKSDTTYSDEETVIHKTVYDTSKTDSNGKHPVLSTTEISTTKHSGSKGKVSQTSTSTKVQNTKLAEKQKTVDKKKDTQKVTSQVKDVNNLIWCIIILVLLVIVGYFVVKYRNVICTFAKKLNH